MFKFVDVQFKVR